MAEYKALSPDKLKVSCLGHCQSLFISTGQDLNSNGHFRSLLSQFYRHPGHRGRDFRSQVSILNVRDIVHVFHEDTILEKQSN